MYFVVCTDVTVLRWCFWEVGFELTGIEFEYTLGNVGHVDS